MIFVSLARKNQIIQKNIFNFAPARRNAIAMKTNPDILVSYTENSFRYQPFNLRQSRIIRGCQRTVVFDAANNCLNVTTMKSMNFQDDIPSTPLDEFRNH